MRPEGFRRTDFKNALKIFSTKVDVWVKLTQCVLRGLTVNRYLFLDFYQYYYI